MQYTKEDLINAINRLAPGAILPGMTLPQACDRAAISIFLRMETLSDTDIQVSKDLVLLRRAIRDLSKLGWFNFSQ